jgi:hypothetical protein
MEGGAEPLCHGMLQLVCFVYLVDLVHLISFVQPNKRDKQNKPNNGLLTLADYFSILLASRLSTLDSTYTVQLPPTLGDGKAFSVSFSVARNEELTLMSHTTLIGPGGEPEYLTAPGIRVGDHVISADTRNTRCIVPAKTSADPDFMFKRRVLTEKPVSIFTRSLQCFALSTMN